MREHPILFGGPMVRAILGGTKTQTRRVVNPQDIEVVDGVPYFMPYRYAEPDPIAVPCPYGAPGDRLWVRETWGVGFQESRMWINYRAHWGDDTQPGNASMDAPEEHYPYLLSKWDNCLGDWYPSIHMPRWASRLTLEVTGIRVERLQDISEADARAEGAELLSEDGMSGWGHTDETCPASYTRRNGFRHLWDSINAKRAPWDSDPWVWVVSFTAAPRREGE